MQRFHDYVEALEEEKKKIQVFQRDLPLAFELVTKAIDSCRKELSTSETVKGQSDCSEKTTDECGGVAVFEEFIPIKMSSSSSDEPCKDDGADDKKKSDWLRSVQLWNPQPEKDQVIYKKATVVEIKRNACAFQMEKPVAVKVDSPQPLKAISQSSTAETSGSKRDSEEQKQSQAHKKQRRCWSQELHRRFLHALQQLGGSHVATPKQIRDLMKVDSLTNDEVKSHLQKYRLHKGRPTTPAVTNGGENLQQPQFMVVEGIWVPSHDAMNNRIYAPVAAQPPRSSPSGERSSRRCKSPATSSSTHTPHILPLSRLV